MLCRGVATWTNLLCNRPVTISFLQESTLPLKDERKSVTELRGKLEKKVRSLFRREVVEPNNLTYPNKYMRPDFDPQVELKDVVEEMPGFLWNNAMEVAKEMKGHFGICKPKMLEDLGNLRNGQFRKDISFKTLESFKFWRCGADSDSNEGLSKCEFVPTDRKTALFRGRLSTELIKDGRIERAGWAAIKFEERGPFLKKRYFSKWSNYSHFLIKCRGDGRTYKISLNSPLLFDITWGDAHSYYLHTHGGPYWQYEAIPFSKFIHTVRNRIMDKQYPIKNINVSSLLIMLMDRIDGDFSLEIDYIGVVHDRSHLEGHSYEAYQLPILFTEDCEINSLHSYWMLIKRWTLIRVFSTDFSASQVPARVILKNVSWFTGEKDLKFHFDRFGKVQHVKLLYDWETGLHRGFAFVVFENIDDAIKAVQQRNHYINGRQIRIRRNNPELFVKRISWVTGALELTDHFSQFGKVRNITLPFDLRTGLHKGFAFISFENNDFYENIRKFEGKHIIDDEEVICSLASEEKSLLLTGTNVTLFDSESSSKMDFSKTKPDNEVETIEFVGAEKNNKEKEVTCETNSQVISINDMNFQNCKTRTSETNFATEITTSYIDSKGKSTRNNFFEKTVSTKLRNLVRENESDNGAYNKAYTKMPSLRLIVAKNGFNG
uniref:RRM domain-containing protein n=1 Tax=Onchocerca volvulus TaxID=6282 RepID=A0A8R1XX74_ONCVO